MLRAAGLIAMALAVAVPPVGAQTQTTVYVSPTGNDANPGTVSSAPVRTLERAQQLHANVVQLADGTYELSKPLTLTAADSGTTWRAAPGAHPVISGGSRVTGWYLSDPARNIWSAPVPAGLKTRQLYVDGVRAQRASGPLPVKLTSTTTGYTASADTLSHWHNPSAIEFVYPGGDRYWSLSTGGQGPWTEPRCPLASATGTTVTMAQPCWNNSTNRIMRTDTSGRTVNLVGPRTLGNNQVPGYVENAYELLDTPGEWYLDDTAHRISYLPKPGQRPAQSEIVAPRLETLVSGQGVSDLTFSGIQFSYATWLRPSTPEGLSEIQANYTLTGEHGADRQGLCQFVDKGACPYGDWTKEPGNLSFSGARGVRFTDDVFTHLGAAGLDLGTGAQDCEVRGSVFTDISGNGLELGGVDHPTDVRTSGNTIADNHLYGLPAEFHGGIPIVVGYSERSLITHNQIDHTAYTGISIGWGGWPDKIGKPATPNYSHDNTISANLITDTTQYLADGGAIYTQGITGSSIDTGEKITGNVISGQTGHGHAIYCDNGCTYLTIAGNVEYGNQNDWGATHANYTPPADGSTKDPLLIQDNYWQQGDADSAKNEVVIRRNHIITGPRQAPAATIANAGLEPAYRHLLTQQVGGRSAPQAPAQLATTGADGAVYVSFSSTFVDNGAPVDSYTVTAQPGGRSVTVSADQYREPHYVRVSGLSNGTAYTFTVTATNAFGTSAPSLPSAATKPSAANTAVPGAPTDVSVRVSGGNASVHWKPPAAVSGTSPVLAYRISAPGLPDTLFQGHTALWADSSRDTFTAVGGLVPGKTYVFTVTALNAAGPGQPGTAKPVTG
ncbi:fibronectin type III domain-containing protein [Kutzneria albida]|uniref:Putative fibronectin type III domain protein n=1 Tax=Kutzneria albida DSM 43870 TaxID=1449976 RepID=W5W3P3_9PSEU|nr:fibronectin type III domain-containing protein [Kutzneria albida]AHH95833.1 putative fibronectin type III domain protein [Kutzneria albida DSM 43870]